MERPQPLDDDIWNLYPALKVLEHPYTGRFMMSLFYARPDQSLLAFLDEYLSVGAEDADLKTFDKMLRDSRGEMWRAIDPHLFDLQASFAPPFAQADGKDSEFRLAKIPPHVLGSVGGRDGEQE